MKNKTGIIALALMASLGVNVALADSTRAMKRTGFTSDITRSTGAGRFMHRHTVQTPTANGFVRKHTLETGSGQTANRQVNLEYDQDTRTLTRSAEGERLNGATYTTQRSAQKTQEGYTKQVTHTNGQGAEASKQVDVIVDKEAKTLTKTITATDYQGETHSAVVVRSYQGGGQE